LAVIGICLAWATPADASCVYLGPLCQTWRNNAAIFDGTVRSIERIDRLENLSGTPEKVGHRLVTLDVHESWLGAVGERTTLILWGGYGVSRSNSFSMEIGKRYLIFAHRDEHGELAVSGCSGSREYSSSSEELAFLRSLRTPGQGGRIFGEVVLFDRNTRGTPGGRVPVKATVRIGGPEFNKVISTEKTFEVTGLKPGSYVVEVEGPRHLEREAPVLVDLPDAHACYDASFYFNHRTSISGRLLDAAGKPLGRRQVEAADAATWQVDPLSPITAYTDDSGRFEFDGLQPGAYVIGVNLRDNPSKSAPEARVLYPSGSAPLPVQVGPGEQVEIGSLQLGPPLPKLDMALRLVWEEGLQIANSAVRIEDVTGGHNPARQRPVGYARADTTGLVRVEGRATRSYIVSSWTFEDGNVREVARSEPFTAEAAATGLVIKMLPVSRR
jgi:hypothetical protein